MQGPSNYSFQNPLQTNEGAILQLKIELERINIKLWFIITFIILVFVAITILVLLLMKLTEIFRELTNTMSAFVIEFDASQRAERKGIDKILSKIDPPMRRKSDYQPTQQHRKEMTADANDSELKRESDSNCDRQRRGTDEQ